MDPNSKNQRWSYWQFEIRPGGIKRPAFADIQTAASKFGRLHWGSVGAMKVDDKYDRRGRKIEIHARVEGAPVHDPTYVAFMTAEWQKWATRGFGNGSTSRLVVARLEAGDRQDGSPRDQLIIADASALRIALTDK